MADRLTASVVMGTFDGAPYIEEQLRSILAQDRLPDEIVVSDDGSRDDTLEIARAPLAEAERRGIRVVLSTRPVNLGVTANFAAAMAVAASDVVVLSDQDDVWHPARLSAALAAFEADPDLDLRHEDARLVDAAGKPLGSTLFESLRVREGELSGIEGGDAFAVYLRRNLATGATVSFRRRLLERAAPFPPEWVHDEWLAIIAAATGRVSVSKKARVDYRQHGRNEIGVVAPTLSHRLSRMLGTSPDRNRALAARGRVLADRLATMPGVSEEPIRAAEAKARFEARRAALPEGRVRRLGGMARADREDGGGNYARFASQGRLDMVRDLVQGHDRGRTRTSS